jgi:protein-tyrosine phosphatase
MTTAGGGTTNPFTVLFVCTGNICRSPLAAQLLVAGLGGASGFRVESAGTMADRDAPMDSTAAAQSEIHGGDPSQHRSQLITERLVENADLILTAERSHRGKVVAMVPRASRKTFTILQFDRVLRGIQAEGLADVPDAPALVAAVAAARGSVAPPPDPGDDDVDDPYRRSMETHERVAATIDDAVSDIADALRAAGAVRA